MEEVKYQYRDKVNGQWITFFVTAKQIRELVINGTLNPYDFIRKNVNEVGKDPQWKKFMIRKNADEEITQEEEFKDIVQDWTKLLSVRTKLDQLWKAQRDSLLAKITQTDSEKTLDKTRGDKIPFKPIHKTGNISQVHRFVKDIEESCLSYWRKAEDILETLGNNEPEGCLQKEIKNGVRADCFKNPNKYCIDGLERVEVIDGEAYEKKKQKVRDWLSRSGFYNKWGVYIFYNGDGKPEYIGEAAPFTDRFGNWRNGNFGDRFFNNTNSHFQTKKPWCLQFTKIRILLLNTFGGNAESVKKEKSQAMERMLILKYNLDELQNIQSGTKKSPADDILSKLESEVEGLCDDGELIEMEARFKQEKEKLQLEIERLKQK